MEYNETDAHVNKRKLQRELRSVPPVCCALYSNLSPAQFNPYPANVENMVSW